MNKKGEESKMVLIASVPIEAASTARTALDANGIEYIFDSGLGVTGFRVDAKVASKALAVLQADARHHSYDLIQAN